MILRKPYALLIQYFQRIHLLLILLCAYIFYKILALRTFVADFFITLSRISKFSPPPYPSPSRGEGIKSVLSCLWQFRMTKIVSEAHEKTYLLIPLLTYSLHTDSRLSFHSNSKFLVPYCLSILVTSPLRYQVLAPVIFTFTNCPVKSLS